MTRFTDILWQDSLPIYDQILRHPFNQELKSGTLDVQKFKFYIYQDSLYLADFARALATAGTRSSTNAQLLDFLHFAQNAIWVERALHESYFQEYAIDFNTGKAPGCFAYTNYLLAVSSFDQFEVAVAALLPCFVIYKEIGDYIKTGQVSPNPYQNWINAYSGEEFANAVQKVLSICNEIADDASAVVRAAMKKAYQTATRMEYIFWDSAYRQEQWPV